MNGAAPRRSLRFAHRIGALAAPGWSPSPTGVLAALHPNSGSGEEEGLGDPAGGEGVS